MPINQTTWSHQNLSQFMVLFLIFESLYMRVLKKCPLLPRWGHFKNHLLPYSLPKIYKSKISTSLALLQMSSFPHHLIQGNCALYSRPFCFWSRESRTASHESFTLPHQYSVFFTKASKTVFKRNKLGLSRILLFLDLYHHHHHCF